MVIEIQDFQDIVDSSNPALVLNADYRPLSYLPLSIWSWRESVKATFMARVDVVAEYDQVIRSPSVSIKIPSVVVLKEYVKPANTVVFTRFNLFLRDEFKCQYCGCDGDMTFDHVVPRSNGGRTTWENVVAACSHCNIKKGAKAFNNSNMKLSKIPIKPSVSQLLNQGRKFPPNYLHESWADFLYWDAELKS